MTVAFKAPVESAVVNNAFISKLADDIKTGKFTLAKPAEGSTIFSVQKSLNEIFANQGYTEGDAGATTYATQYYITNGDNQKECIETLDDSLKGVDDLISNHLLSATAHNASDIIYNNLASGLSADNAQEAIDEVELRVQDIEDAIGQPSGIATLDGGGKVPASQLPSSVMTYEGTWDASTNTPTLADGIGDSGMVYLVNVAGSQDLGSGLISFNLGDWVVYNGTIWEKSLNSNAVVSVNGFTGVVTLTKSDIGLSNVTNDAQLKRSAGDFNTFTEKLIPIENDIVLIEDSVDSYNKKKVKLENMLGGGGGGGSFAWELNGDFSPIEAIIKGMSVLNFDDVSNHEIYALIVIPDSYKTGKQILLQGMKYFTSATTNNVFFKTETQLLKSGQDISALPITGHTSSNLEVTLSGSANILRDIGDLDLTSPTGQVNGVGVAIGDLLLVKFFRDNTNETIPANADCSLIKYSSTLKLNG
jgi:hypothetical protein